MNSDLNILQTISKLHKLENVKRNAL